MVDANKGNKDLLPTEAMQNNLPTTHNQRQNIIYNSEKDKDNGSSKLETKRVATIKNNLEDNASHKHATQKLMTLKGRRRHETWNRRNRDAVQTQISRQNEMQHYGKRENAQWQHKEGQNQTFRTFCKMSLTQKRPIGTDATKMKSKERPNPLWHLKGML